MTVTVLSGPERRRRWTIAEKLRIVEESLASDAVASEVARRHDVHPNQLHAWRRMARLGLLIAAPLAAEADEKVYNVIQLIYRTKNYEGTSKDYQFSRRMMEEHWTACYNDAVRTLRHPEVLQRPNGRDGFFTFDLARDGRE